MAYIRRKIQEDKEERPKLHSKAISLGLKPQPWWSNEFYKHSIKQKEGENE